MTYQFIETDEALGALLEQHSGERFVAVDTEFRRRDTFYPQVALLQLCWKKESYLIDPVKISDLDSVKALLADSRVIKLIHSPSEDLEVFDRWLQMTPTPLFDTCLLYTSPSPRD